MHTFKLFSKFMAALALSAGLAACGGGGGNASAPAASPTATAVVSALTYQLDKPSITTSSSDRTTLTVTVLDSSNNPMSGVTTTVALDSGVYTPVNTVSDVNGLAVGVITVGSNKTNRNITATMGIKGQTSPSSTAVVNVKGTAITLLATPSTVTGGGVVKLDAVVADGAGVGIANAPLALTGTLGFSQTLTSDFSGLASTSIDTGSLTPGNYSVVATGMGTSTTVSIRVVDSNPSAIPSAVGTVSAASISAVPSNVAPNTAGSTSNRAALRAVFQDASNKGIQNIRVRFEIVSPSLGANEVISSGTSTVYSDTSGVAQASYIPDTRSSPTNGVIIRACYGASDDEIANNACPKSVRTTLTVATQPLAVSIGDNNELTRGNNNLTYIKMFDIAVADAAGNPVAGAVVSASVDIAHYGKGLYAASGVGTLPDGTTGTFTYPQSYSQPTTIEMQFPTTQVPGFATGRVWCQNEDINRNGFSDTGEDINGNGKLDPRKSDMVLSFVDKNVTDSVGRLAIRVEYAQSVATWLSYTVKATTSVSGSEGTEQKSYITRFIVGDDLTGSFLTPPYGVGSCVSAN